LNQDKRKAQIEAAAYKILNKKGFKGASMLAIAKEAKASNETLYKWYGDKTGLFKTMIESNTMIIVDMLSNLRNRGVTGLPALQSVGESLLAMVTSENAIALNRAAAGDITGKLGGTLATEGRGRVFPILAELMEEAYGTDENIKERADCFIALLIGDLQIRCATSAIERPNNAAIKVRTQRAINQLGLIYPVPNPPE
jgi:AcrR family transcriptional regulator